MHLETTMLELLHTTPLILMEGAISESLARKAHLRLHPELSVSPLIYEAAGRCELERLYRGYLQVAIDADLPFVMLTPTWRANRQRVQASGVTADINRDAALFMQRIREEAPCGKTIVIGGLTGCKNDAYQPAEGLPAKDAEAFHAWQIGELAAAGVDFLIAETLPAVPEAVGIARAMEKTGRPYIISFVIDREGLVLDGTPLAAAVEQVDAATQRRPLGFMVNCSYPTFLKAGQQPAALFERLVGYQANASALDHCDLDNADALKSEDVSAWGRAMLALNETYGVKILGGCCGTGVDHLRYLAEHRRCRLP